jgi:hypothetical protein
MMSEIMWNMMREWEAVSSQIVQSRLKCKNEEWVKVGFIGPEIEKNDNERE